MLSAYVQILLAMASAQQAPVYTVGGVYLPEITIVGTVAAKPVQHKRVASKPHARQLVCGPYVTSAIGTKVAYCEVR